MIQRRPVKMPGAGGFENPELYIRWAIIGAIALVALWFIFSSFYTVDADEVGVIQRFGRFTKITQPGLHFKIPFGVETVKKVRVRRVFKEEFGFRTLKAGVRTTYAERSYLDESLMLTGDLNTAVVEWIVQYRVKDPAKFLFKVRNMRKTIRDVSEASMRMIVGDHSVDEVIITRRQDISQMVKDLIQKKLDEYETGIDIVTVNLQDVNPPEPVQPAFNEVNEAKQEKERIINEAWEAYNKAIPQAKGRAEQTIREAEGYAVDRINRAEGDANRFLAMWREYSRAKDVTRRRMYLETMMQMLPEVQQIYVVDENLRSIVPLLQLGGVGKGVKK